jgi:hypothetical protein
MTLTEPSGSTSSGVAPSTRHSGSPSLATRIREPSRVKVSMSGVAPTVASPSRVSPGTPYRSTEPGSARDPAAAAATATSPWLAATLVIAANRAGSTAICPVCAPLAMSSALSVVPLAT